MDVGNVNCHLHLVCALEPCSALATNSLTINTPVEKALRSSSSASTPGLAVAENPELAFGVDIMDIGNMLPRKTDGEGSASYGHMLRLPKKPLQPTELYVCP